MRLLFDDVVASMVWFVGAFFMLCIIILGVVMIMFELDSSALVREGVLACEDRGLVYVEQSAHYVTCLDLSTDSFDYVELTGDLG